MTEFGFRMASPRPRPRPLWHVVLPILVAVVAFGALAVKLMSGPADYPAGTQGAMTAVTVNDGDSLRTIARELADAGITASVDAGVEAGTANVQSRYITPGDYKLPAHIPAATAITLLLNPESRNSIKLVVPEGLRAREIYALVAAKLKLDTATVARAFTAQKLPASAGGRVEGYLFPATYELKHTDRPADVAKMMLTRFQQTATDLELERRARAEQLTVHDVMVIASILEQEAAPADFSKVARVILNRLARNMPLQLDSTVNYGLGISRIQLSQAQLDRDTPFNTYLHTGLPPTPIDNPGAAAIEAALSPAVGDWMYFVTTDPKKQTTEFARTYAEFMQLKAKFLRNN